MILLGANTIIQLLPEETVAAIGLDEALEPAKESAGPRPTLDEVKTIDENKPSADEDGKASDSDENGASGQDDDATLLRDGYKEIERKAIEALLDANR